MRIALARAKEAKRTLNIAQNELNALKRINPDWKNDPRARAIKDEINRSLREQAAARKELRALGHSEPRPFKGRGAKQEQPKDWDEFEKQAFGTAGAEVLAKARAKEQREVARREAEKLLGIDPWATKNAREAELRVKASLTPEQAATITPKELNEKVQQLMWSDGSAFGRGKVIGEPVAIPKDGNINSVFKVKIEDDGNGFYKPLGGESNKARPYTGTMARREVMAYHVDRLLGFDQVPETKLVDLPSHGIGSVQAEAKNSANGTAWVGWAADPANHPSAAKMFALDLITENVDRHSANYRISYDDEKLHLIDNGMTFMEAANGWGARIITLQTRSTELHQRCMKVCVNR